MYGFIILNGAKNLKNSTEGGISMHNLAKIRLDEKGKRELEQYREALLNYLKILDEFDMDLMHEKIEAVGNNTV